MIDDLHTVLASPFAPSRARRRLLSDRDEALGVARGRVLVVAAGGVDLRRIGVVDSVALIAASAATRARATAVPPALDVAVVDEPLGGAPLFEHSFDSVVSLFALCWLPDLAAGLAELERLLAPEGELSFAEHVPGSGWRRALEPALAAVAARAGATTCRARPDVLAAMRRAGFAVTDCRRTGATVVGRARRVARRVAP